jgi:CheY-like chemotaxis protein
MKEDKQLMPLNILLADDDKDDRFFFEKALKTLSIKSKLESVIDGEKLIAYLAKNSSNLPDVLFLDLNMPRKNGSECLAEIKANKDLYDFPIIIYSTSLNDDIADILYRDGAYYYMRKCDISELVVQLEMILTRLADKKLKRPLRSKFILTLEQFK